jgi:uncharacterized membrane protein
MRHDVNRALYVDAPLGARVADRVTGFLGSWTFLAQAAYAAPLILLAGNRAALRDRMTLEHTAAEADLEDQQNRQLLEADTKILERIAEVEKRILDLEKRILERLEPAPDRASSRPPGGSPPSASG